MPSHLEPVPEPADDRLSDELDVGFEDDLEAPLVRPVWWRWVAIAVIVAMAVAGPIAFALYRVLS